MAAHRPEESSRAASQGLVQTELHSLAGSAAQFVRSSFFPANSPPTPAPSLRSVSCWSASAACHPRTRRRRCASCTCGERSGLGQGRMAGAQMHVWSSRQIVPVCCIPGWYTDSLLAVLSKRDASSRRTISCVVPCPTRPTPTPHPRSNISSSGLLLPASSPDGSLEPLPEPRRLEGELVRFHR